MTPPAAAPDPTRTPTCAAGVGLATLARDGRVLDVLYPEPRVGEDPGALGGLAIPAALEAAAARADERRGVTFAAIRMVIEDLSAPPVDAADVYLRLHLISHRLVRPHAISLEGVFGLLGNVAWTNHGPIDPPELVAARLAFRVAGEALTVTSVDKFPRMTDYVVPSGVRIGDADRVRLGAHLAPGTTIMHEGFVNYNAGTLGASMVEGRIAAGVVIGDGSDVGGGASIMGTLSGGGTQVVSVGQRCLLGANSGLGISLGDDCIVEAGLYLTAGTRVTTPDGEVVKALALSGAEGLLFRRDSETGRVDAMPRSGRWSGLNAVLHAND